MNYIEDSLIYKIDSQRAGLDLDELKHEQKLNERRLSFVIKGLAQAITSANRYPECGDVQLLIRAEAAGMLEIRCKGRQAGFIKASGVSLRQLRQLPKTDLRRQSLEMFELKIRTLQAKRESLIDSYHARKYLREQRALVEIYLNARGRTTRGKIDLCMERLRTLYPAQI